MIQVFYYLRRWVGWLVVIAAAAGIGYWGLENTGQPKVIRIATASKGGYYYKFGTLLKRSIEKQTPYRVELQATAGSVDNRGRLLAGKTDLAILQTSAVSMENLSGLAPLWDDYVQVIVRKHSRIHSIRDLPGHNIAIGKKGSGYRANAMHLLDFYGIDPATLGDNTAYFLKLLDNRKLEGAIVTTNLDNPDLRQVMASGEFRLLPLSGAAGFVFNHSYYRAKSIPEGVYPSADGPLPDHPVRTVATEAILAARPDAPAGMISAIMPVLYSTNLRVKAPVMVGRDPSNDPMWRLLPLNKTAGEYYNPYAGFGAFANLLNKLAEFKELLIFLVVLVAVGGYQWKQHRRHRQGRKVRALMRDLEKLFEEVVQIEQAQKQAKDVRLLHEQMSQLGYIKMKALKFVLGSPIEDSGLFLAFLQQWSSVVREIEWRLSLAATAPASGPRSVRTG